MRKLADFAFMLRDWKLAHSTYDIVRKDFANDKAWKYAAGAQVPTPPLKRESQNIILRVIRK